jgi:hypothetical protein
MKRPTYIKLTCRAPIFKRTPDDANERTIVVSLDKADYMTKGRKTNEVRFTMTMRTEKGRPVFAVQGEVWNNRGTDILAGGQCIDLFAELVSSHRLPCECRKIIKALLPVWKAYHLNDMHPGTPEQEDYLVKTGNVHCDYDRACEVLEKAGLYTVTLEDGTPYKYGHGWTYRPLPDELTEGFDRLWNMIGEEHVVATSVFFRTGLRSDVREFLESVPVPGK